MFPWVGIKEAATGGWIARELTLGTATGKEAFLTWRARGRNRPQASQSHIVLRPQQGSKFDSELFLVAATGPFLIPDSTCCSRNSPTYQWLTFSSLSNRLLTLELGEKSKVGLSSSK